MASSGPAFSSPTLALQPQAIMLLSPAGGKRLLGGDDGLEIEAMTDATKTVLAEALRLDVDSRAELAAEILASLDGPADPDVEAAWAVEIERRDSNKRDPSLLPFCSENECQKVDRRPRR